MKNVTVAVETLGCKVNQYESSHFLELFDAAGYSIVSSREPADVYIVHSCAVTSRAAFQTRQLLRRVQRVNPGASVVVAGCNAQIEPERFVEERLATHVLGTIEKLDILNWIQVPASLSSPCVAVGDPREATRLLPAPVRHMHSRARAFLKIQDGCNAFCSYCIVPRSRGRSRSLPTDEVIRQMDRFVSSGYEEVVLTGIHLGQWGNDLETPAGLADLIEDLHNSTLPRRVRLSSIEPMEWTGELLRTLADLPWICPHFHVPLQSGDGEILAMMRRPYDPVQYGELILELRRLFPDASLGADVMVGFPGETDKHFENTFRLIDRLPLSYLHVFPYSPRPGTEAARRPGRVAGTELKRRARVLQELGSRKRRLFQRGFVGRHVEVLAETEVSPGWWRGTSANYLPVLFPSARPIASGSIVVVSIDGLGSRDLQGGLASLIE